MRILYGTPDTSIDVTDICLTKLIIDNVIIIPYGDMNRAKYFTDPLVGVHKSMIITINDITSIYDEYTLIKINILDKTIYTESNTDIVNRLNSIHSKLKIKYGHMNDELPEQKMVARYLTGSEKVLEIGGNIGRNSLVIASIVENSNFVVLECDIGIASQLLENRDLNNFKFYIESAALSNRKLIQKAWDTIPSDTLLNGYKWVNTITLEQLRNKYSIEFDTLVLDCEGAFYYILMDMPNILDNIRLIIMENDYHDITHKKYVDDILTKNNFRRNYVEQGGWGPCYHNFFEVWKR
jgi:FkbM family methyltransferase